jgi:thioredoxin reductase (NADPH)
VVEGGNSAGQAAVFLSQSASQVHILIRSHNLVDAMSRYLIRRIDESRNMTLHPKTEIVELHGVEHLEGLSWRSNESGSVEDHTHLKTRGNSDHDVRNNFQAGLS